MKRIALFILFSFVIPLIIAGAVSIRVGVKTASGETRLIKDLQRGDRVMAARIVNGALEWVPQNATVVATTGNLTRRSLLQIAFGDADASIIVSADQLFLVQGFKMKRAGDLVPGFDCLVDPSGNSLQIRSVSSGQFWLGVGSVGVGSISDALNKDGYHLLNIGGIVVGDFYMQTKWKSSPPQHVSPGTGIPPHRTGDY